MTSPWVPWGLWLRGLSKALHPKTLHWGHRLSLLYCKGALGSHAVILTVQYNTVQYGLVLQSHSCTASAIRYGRPHSCYHRSQCARHFDDHCAALLRKLSCQLHASVVLRVYALLGDASSIAPILVGAVVHPQRSERRFMCARCRCPPPTPHPGPVQG